MTNENTDQKKSSEYQTNYDTLKATADKLKEAENAIDIDALLEEVESAMKAYEFCKDRINTVQTKLDELLKDAPGSDASSTDAAEKKQQSSNGDDIPF